MVSKRELTAERAITVSGNYENYLICRYLQEEKEKGYGYAILDTNQLEDPSSEWMLFELPYEKE